MSGRRLLSIGRERRYPGGFRDSDFSFRGLEPRGFTGAVNVIWTAGLGTPGTIAFTGVKGPDADFDRPGIVSTDGETLKSVEIVTPGTESFKEIE